MTQTVRFTLTRARRLNGVTLRTFTLPPVRFAVTGEVDYWQRPESVVRAGASVR